MRRTLVVMAILALTAGACSGDDPELGVAEAWARPAIGPNGAVYLTIEGGETDTALVAAAAPPNVTATVELHQTVVREDGAMGMTHVSEVEIPAGSTVMMVPGGLHVMLLDLAEPLVFGDTFDMTLMFDDGTELTTTVEVRDE